MFIEGVCVALIRDGKLLVISRKDNPNDFGLPGGKVDEDDETVSMAAARELKEETGIDIPWYDMMHVWTGTEKYQGNAIECYFFMVMRDDGQVPTQQPGEGQLKWASSWHTVMAGSFGGYYRELLHAVPWLRDKLTAIA